MQFIQHTMNRCSVNRGFTVFCTMGLFFPKHTIASKPRTWSFNDPASRNDHKTFNIIRFFGNLDGYRIRISKKFNICHVCSISPHPCDRWIALTNTIEQIIRSITIADMCRKNTHKEDISVRINENMAFSTINFFPIHRSRVHRLIPWL